MTAHNDEAAKQASLSALESVQHAQSKLALEARPPLWLNALATLSLGGILLRDAFGEAPAVLISVVSLVGFFGTYIYYRMYLHDRGLSVRVIPSSTAGKLVQLALCVMYLGLLIGGDKLNDRGQGWALWAAALLICLIFAAVLHFLPTSERIARHAAQ